MVKYISVKILKVELKNNIPPLESSTHAFPHSLCNLSCTIPALYTSPKLPRETLIKSILQIDRCQFAHINVRYKFLTAHWPPAIPFINPSQQKFSLVREMSHVNYFLYWILWFFFSVCRGVRWMEWTFWKVGLNIEDERETERT